MLNRVEFDYLTQLLRSRTFEPDRSKPTTNKEEKEETVVSAQDNGVGGSKSLQDFSTPSKCLIVRKLVCCNCSSNSFNYDLVSPHLRVI